MISDAPPTDCDYAEQSDLTNDDVSDPPGTPEATGLTFTTKSVVCGSFASTHFDGDITVDVDSFDITTSAEGDVLLRLVGGGLSSIEYAGVDIYPAGTTTLLATATFYGSHGVAAVHLPAGNYTLTVFALGSGAISAPESYQVELSADMPDTRCAELTAGGYNESTAENDVITIPSGNPPALTPASDTPEPSSIVLAPGTPNRVTGTAADIATTDQYEDKDTYAIATGTGTDELTVRLTWPTAGANLDWILFEANTAVPVIRAVQAGTTGPEMKISSVKPNTSYWLLVGAKAGTTVPATYTATLCGAQFTP